MFNIILSVGRIAVTVGVFFALRRMAWHELGSAFNQASTLIQPLLPVPVVAAETLTVASDATSSLDVVEAVQGAVVTNGLAS